MEILKAFFSSSVVIGTKVRRDTLPFFILYTSVMTKVRVITRTPVVGKAYQMASFPPISGHSSRLGMSVIGNMMTTAIVINIWPSIW